MQLNEVSATGIVERIASGKTSAQEVMHACLARIREREESVGAFAALDDELAMNLARQSDLAGRPGKLRGVPFAIKDIVDTVDFPTEWGSPIYAGHVPRRNASCVELFLGEGAIPVGKSVTTEFACFNPGKTVNPRNPSHTPGGSSSGSAAAVADCMVPLGFGSQTAASVIRPAAFCGVFAYKASHGAIDLEGVMGLSPNLDSLGVMARSVHDLRLSRSVLCRAPPKSEAPGSSALRIALFRGPHWMECSPSVREACTRAMSHLSNNGVDVAEVAYPEAFSQLSSAHKTIMAFDVATARSYEFKNHRQHLSGKFQELVQAGLETTYGEYSEALLLRNHAETQLESMFAGSDALLCPASSGEAPMGLEATGDPLFSRMWTLLKLPAVSIPYGAGDRGLPLAVQLVGRHGDDDRLLAAAERVADVLDGN